MTLSGENIVSPHQYFLDLHVFLFIVVKNWMDLSFFFPHTHKLGQLNVALLQLSNTDFNGR